MLCRKKSEMRATPAQEAKGMKQIWRDIRAVLRGAVVQAVAKAIAGLLAVFGAVSAVDPDVPAALHGERAVPLAVKP